MAKGSLVCVLLAIIITVNAQGFGYFRLGGDGLGFGAPMQGPPGDFQNIVLHSVSNRLYAQGLPEDLQNRLTDTLGKAELAFAGCESVAYWQYRRCTALELKNAIAEINAIENEAKARLATTVAPPAIAPASDPVAASPVETAAPAAEPAPAEPAPAEPAPAEPVPVTSAPAVVAGN